jgi:hypothetical protein
VKPQSIHVLLYPIGAPEAEVMACENSNSYIGMEQYRLIKATGRFPGARLFQMDGAVAGEDILLIMLPLPQVPLEIIKKFNKVVYYYDDMSTVKAELPEYRLHFEQVSVYISPLADTAAQMNAAGLKKSYHVPWSMCPIEYSINKSEKPSILVDMDGRDFTRYSIDHGFGFSQRLLGLGIQPFAFKRFEPHCPAELHPRIRFIENMPRPEFLRFLSTMWAYASGIRGSYEFCVLESAMSGCALISLYGALPAEHWQRRSYLKYSGEAKFEDTLRTMLASYDPLAVQQDALTLYPRDAKQQLEPILRENFG